MTSSAYFTPAELANRWSCSVGWLANRRSSGSGGPAYIKVGTKVLYPIDTVESYEASRLVQVGA